MRKKLNAAAGLVTIAAAGALIASTPAYAEESITPTAETSALVVPASATLGQQLNLFAGTPVVANDGHRRRHRHRRYWRHHRRHYRHWHHRRWHHRHWHHRHHHRYWH